MRVSLFWIFAGGTSFWLPAIFVLFVLDPKVNALVDMLTINIAPMVGIILLGAASWITTKREPKWGWVLAGIYIFGPAAMLGPSFIFPNPGVTSLPGDNLRMIVFCLIPPMTLWLATLNGTIFSVLLVTFILSVRSIVVSLHSKSAYSSR